MDKRYAAGLAAGFTSAVLAASALTGSMISLVLVYVSPLPLMIAGLGWGVKSVAVAAGVGTAGYLLITSFWGGVLYAVAIAFPALGITHLALLARPAGGPEDAPSGGIEWYPANRLTVWMLVMAVGGVVFLHLILLGQGGLPGMLRASHLPVLETYIDQIGGGDLPVPRGQLIDMLLMTLPGFMAAGWLMIMGANTVLAQKIVTLSARAIRGNFGVARMSLPPVVVMVLAAAVVASPLPGLIGFAGTTAMIVLLAPYFVFGLITIHVVSAGWVRRSHNPDAFAIARILGLATVYISLQVLMIPIVVLGLTDQWIGLRQRALAHAAKEENE